MPIKMCLVFPFHLKIFNFLCNNIMRGLPAHEAAFNFFEDRS